MDNKKVSSPLLKITNTLMNDLIERHDNGTLTGQTQRLFRKGYGKRCRIFGIKKYKDVGIRHSNDIKSKDVVNFMNNMKNAYLKRSVNDSGETVLILRDSSTKERSWFRKQFYKLGRGLTHFREAKEVRRTARELLTSRVASALSELTPPDGVSEEAKVIYNKVVNQWKELLSDIIYLEIKSYTRGTGKQDLKAHKYLRLSFLLDKFLNYARVAAKEAAINCDNGNSSLENKGQELFDQVAKITHKMTKYQKSGGLHQMHNYLGKLSKGVSALDKYDYSLAPVRCLPQSPKELREYLTAIYCSSGNLTMIPSLLTMEIATSFNTLVESLPSPVSSAMKDSILGMHEQLVNALQLGDAGQLLKTPQIISVEEANRVTKKNDKYASGLLILMEKVTELFKDLSAGKESAVLHELPVLKGSDTFQTLFRYVASVYDVLRSHSVLNTVIEKDTTVGTLKYYDYKRNLLQLQLGILELHPNKNAEEIVAIQEELSNAEEELNETKASFFYDIVKEESRKVNLNKSSIRAKRLLSGIRKTMFSSSTVASKVFRRTVATIGVVGSAVSLPIVGAQVLAVPVISNGDWIAIATAQMSSLFTKLGVLGGVFGSAVASSVAAQVISNYRSEKSSTSQLYEDSYFVNKWYGYTPQDLGFYKTDFTDKSFIESDIPDVDVIFNLTNLQGKPSERILKELEIVLVHYVPAWTSKYPRGIIAKLLTVLHDIEEARGEKGLVYNAVYTVLLPYISQFKNKLVAAEAYLDLEKLLINPDGGLQQDILFTLADATKDPALVDKEIKEELIGIIHKELDKLVGKAQGERSRFSFKHRDDGLYAAFSTIDEIISRIDYSKTESLTAWQREFTPQILNEIANSEGAEGLRNFVGLYLDKWMEANNNSLPGLIASMCHACFLMDDIADTDSMEVKDGVLYHPTMQYYVLSSILQYINNIEKVTEVQGLASIILEFLYLVADSNKLSEVLKTGVLDKHSSKYKLYNIEGSDDAPQEQVKNTGLDRHSIYFPFSSGIISQVQSLWKAVHSGNLEEDYRFLMNTLTTLNNELLVKNNTKVFQDTASAIQSKLASPEGNKALVDIVSQHGIGNLLYDIMSNIFANVNNPSCDASYRAELQGVANTLFALIYKALEKRSLKNERSLVSDSHLLYSILEQCINVDYINPKPSADYLGLLGDKYRITNIVTYGFPHNMSLVSRGYLVAPSLLIKNYIYAASGRSLHPENVASRINAVTEFLQVFFNDVMSEVEESGEGSPLNSLISALISEVSSVEGNEAYKLEFIQGIIRALCTSQSIATGRLAILAGLGLTDEEERDLVAILQNLYNTYVGVSSAVGGISAGDDLTATEIDDSDFSVETLTQVFNHYASRNIYAAVNRLKLLLNRELSQILDINSQDFSDDALSSLIGILLQCHMPILEVGKSEGVYVSGVLVQHLIQYIDGISNDSVRARAIDILQQALCRVSGGVELRNDISFDFKQIQSSDISGGIQYQALGNDAYTNSVIIEMLRYLDETKASEDRFVTNKDIQDYAYACWSMYNLLDTAVRNSGTGNALILDANVLQEALFNLGLIVHSEEFICRLQAHYGTVVVLSNISELLAGAVANTEDIKSLLIIKEILVKVQQHCRVFSQIPEEVEKTLEAVKGKIHALLSGYSYIADYHWLATILGELSRNGISDISLIETVQYILQSYFDVTQDSSEINTELFQHFLSGVLAFVSECKRTGNTRHIHIEQICQLIIHHLLSMDKEVATAYYRLFLEMFTYVNPEQERKIIPMLVSEIENPDASYSSLKIMMQMASAIILGRGFVSRAFFDLKGEYRDLLQAIETSAPKETVESLFLYVVSDLMRLNPEEYSAITLVLNLPNTLPPLLSLLSSRADLYSSNLYNLLCFISKLYTNSAFKDEQLVKALDKLISKVESSLTSDNGRGYTQVSSHDLSTEMNIYLEHKDESASCEAVVKNYMDRYFHIHGDSQYSTGVVSHFIRTVLQGVESSFASYRGLLIASLLKYIRGTIQNKNILTQVYDECKNALCYSREEHSQLPVLKDSVADILNGDGSEDNNAGVYSPESAHYQVVLELYQLHIQLYPSVAHTSGHLGYLFSINEAALMRRLVQESGDLDPNVRIVLNHMDAMHSLNLIQGQNSLMAFSRLSTKEFFSLLINMIHALSVVRNEEDRALLQKCFDICAGVGFTNISGHVVAAYLEKKDSSQGQVKVSDCMVASIANLPALLRDTEVPTSDKKTVLYGILKGLSVLSLEEAKEIPDSTIITLVETLSSLSEDEAQIYGESILEILNIVRQYQHLGNALLNKVLTQHQKVSAIQKKNQDSLASLLSVSSGTAISSMETMKEVVKHLANIYRGEGAKSLGNVVSHLDIKKIVGSLFSLYRDALGTGEQAVIADISVLAQSIEGILQESGSINLALLMKKLLQENTTVDCAQYLICPEIPQAIKTLLIQIVDKLGSSVNIEAFLGSLDSQAREEVAAVILKDALEKGNGDLQLANITLFKKVISTVMSSKWRTLLSLLESGTSLADIVLEAIMGIYQNSGGLQSDISYMRIIAILASFIQTNDRIINQEQLLNYIISFINSVISVRDKDTEYTNSYNMLLQFCKTLLPYEEIEVRNQIRFVVEPQSLFIESLSDTISSLCTMEWQDASGVVNEELELRLYNCLERFSCLDYNSKVVIDQGLLSLFIFHILSFSENKTEQYYDVCSRLLQHCLQLLPEDATSYSILIQIISEFISSGISAPTSDTAIQGIMNWNTYVDLLREHQSGTAYKELAVLGVFLGAIDPRTLPMDVVISLIQSILNFPFAFNPIYRERSLAILRALAPMCSVETHPLVYAQVQNVLSQGAQVAAWSNETGEEVKDALSQSTGAKQDIINKFISDYCHKYLLDEGVYNEGAVGHLLGIAQGLESVGVSLTDVISALLTQIDSSTVSQATLERIYDEVVANICTEDSLQTGIMRFDTTKYGAIGEGEKTEQQCMEELITLKAIGRLLYSIGQKISNKPRVPLSAFELLWNMYTVAEKPSLLSQREMSPTSRVLIKLLVSSIEKTDPKDVVHIVDKEHLQRFVALLTREQRFCGASTDRVEKILKFCALLSSEGLAVKKKMLINNRDVAISTTLPPRQRAILHNGLYVEQSSALHTGGVLVQGTVEGRTIAYSSPLFNKQYAEALSYITVKDKLQGIVTDVRKLMPSQDTAQQSPASGGGANFMTVQIRSEATLKQCLDDVLSSELLKAIYQKEGIQGVAYKLQQIIDGVKTSSAGVVITKNIIEGIQKSYKAVVTAHEVRILNGILCTGLLEYLEDSQLSFVNQEHQARVLSEVFFSTTKYLKGDVSLAVSLLPCNLNRFWNTGNQDINDLRARVLATVDTHLQGKVFQSFLLSIRGLESLQNNEAIMMLSRTSHTQMAQVVKEVWKHTPTQDWTHVVSELFTLIESSKDRFSSIQCQHIHWALLVACSQSIKRGLRHRASSIPKEIGPLRAYLSKKYLAMSGELHTPSVTLLPLVVLGKSSEDISVMFLGPENHVFETENQLNLGLTTVSSALSPLLKPMKVVPFSQELLQLDSRDLLVRGAEAIKRDIQSGAMNVKPITKEDFYTHPFISCIKDSKIRSALSTKHPRLSTLPLSHLLRCCFKYSQGAFSKQELDSFITVVFSILEMCDFNPSFTDLVHFYISDTTSVGPLQLLGELTKRAVKDAINVQEPMSMQMALVILKGLNGTLQRHNPNYLLGLLGEYINTPVTGIPFVPFMKELLTYLQNQGSESSQALYTTLISALQDLKEYVASMVFPIQNRAQMEAKCREVIEAILK